MELHTPSREFKDGQVVIKDIFGEVHTKPFLQWYAGIFVVQHAHWDGKYYGLVRERELLIGIYHRADGFGPWDEQLDEYMRGGLDWSHIRDSSDEAMVRIAEWLVSEMWADESFAEKAAQMLSWAVEFEMDPLELV